MPLDVMWFFRRRGKKNLFFVSTVLGKVSMIDGWMSWTLGQFVTVTDKMMSHWLRDPWTWSPELQQRLTPDALPFWENLSSGSAWLSGLSRSDIYCSFINEVLSTYLSTL